jgi:hypothetical protein
MNEHQLFEQLSKNIYEIPKQEKQILSNLNSLLNMFLNQEFANNTKHTSTGSATVMMILYITLDKFDFKDQNLAKAVLKITELYYTKEAVANYLDVTETFLNQIFHSFLIKNPKYLQEAFNLLVFSNSLFSENKFNVAKAYLCVYAYLFRDYSLAKSVTDVLVIQLSSDKYIEHFDYCLMNFYKGLIYLSLEKINDAAVVFLLSLSIYPSNLTHQTYNINQLESVKRLILIYPVVSADLQKLISTSLENNDALLCIKPMENYANIKNVTFNLKSSYEDYMKILSQFKQLLESDKLIVSKIILNYNINADRDYLD